jgi:hypothetical protein
MLGCDRLGNVRRLRSMIEGITDHGATAMPTVRIRFTASADVEAPNEEGVRRVHEAAGLVARRLDAMVEFLEEF